MNPIRNIDAETLIGEGYYKLIIGYVGATPERFLTG